MDRRDFVGALAGLPLVGVFFRPLHPPAAPPRLHTDFEYADAAGDFRLSPDADPEPPDLPLPRCYRRDCLPYLDGRPVNLVRRAQAGEDGWVDVVTGYGNARRLSGRVQLLWATPARVAEFEAAP